MALYFLVILIIVSPYIDLCDLFLFLFLLLPSLLLLILLLLLRSIRSLLPTHDFIVDFIIIFLSHNLRISEYLVYQLLPVTRIDVLRQHHITIFGFKEEIERWVFIDREVLTHLVLSHVDLANDKLEDLSFSESPGYIV